MKQQRRRADVKPSVPGAAWRRIAFRVKGAHIFKRVQMAFLAPGAYATRHGVTTRTRGWRCGVARSGA